MQNGKEVGSSACRGAGATVVWWERKLVQDNAAHLNDDLTLPDVYPRSWYPQHRPLDGEIETLDLLREADGNAELNCVSLCLASFHPRLSASRSRDRDLTHVRELCREVELACVEILAKAGIHTQWIGWNTSALPGRGKHADVVIPDYYGLAEFLAEEHAATFCKFAAVLLVEVENLPMDMQTAVDVIRENREAKERAEVERHRRWWAEREEQDRRLDSERGQRLTAINQKRAAAGLQRLGEFSDWRKVTDAELERFIWSEPVMHAAGRFDVSDVAVHKALKSRGIKKPPQGFWLKVQPGTIPHPKGVPASE